MKPSLLPSFLVLALAVAAALFGSTVLWSTPRSEAHDQLFVDADDANCTDDIDDGAGASATPFCHLQAAIDHLDAHQDTGGTITVRAAEYEESTIAVDHGGFTIQGEAGSPRGAIVITPASSSNQRGFYISDPEGRCDDIVIRHLTLDGGGLLRATRQGILVDDTCERITLEDLEISRWDEQGVRFADSSADLSANASNNSHVRASSIHDNGLAGVELRDGTGDSVEDTGISDNGSMGIMANRETGLQINDAVIDGNSSHGIQEFRGTNTRIARPLISDNGGNGIWVTGSESGLQITDGQIGGNDGEGIFLEEDTAQQCGADASIRDMEVYTSGQNGIRAECQRNLRVTDTLIRDNQASGISLLEDVDAGIDGNEIFRNGTHGVAAVDETSLDITNNRPVRENGGDGLHLEIGDATTVSSNDIRNNLGDGMEFRSERQLVADGNTAVDNTAFGIVANEGQSNALRANEVTGNGDSGIWARRETLLVVTGNTVGDNGRHGIQLEENTNATVEKNTIAENGDDELEHGIHVMLDRDLTIRKNVLSRNFDTQVFIDSAKDVFVLANDFDLNTDGIAFGAEDQSPTGIVIGGSGEDRNRFRGLTPGVTRCDDASDSCYVQLDGRLLPSTLIDARRNDWGTTDLGQIEDLICHNNEPGCGLGRVDFANPEPPGASPAVKETPGPTPTPTRPVPTPPPGCQNIAGDANGDGSVNSIDATLVLQYVAGLLGSLRCQANADANRDGMINSIDATLILQYVAGLLDRLPP